MTRTPDALVHHEVRGTHWLNAEALRTAVADRRPDLAVAVARTPAESRRLIPDVEILLSSFLDPALLAEADSLRWIQALSAGVDTLAVDEDRLRERGIVLTSAAGAHAQPIAEQVLAYLLTFARRLDRAFAAERRGAWERYTGGELAGETLGIVGVGSIGRRTAEIASAVGMDVVGTKRDASEEIDAVDRLHPPGELEAVLVEAGYVLVSCPLTEATRGLLGRAEIGAMRDDAVLVNVARGEIVDEAALIEALQQRTIRGAALDVFETEPLPADSPLWDLSNVVVTPHNAGSTPRLPGRIADIFVENLEAHEADAPDRMRNRVL
jgi:phosphoglycerate dehydrogenase-like enzyme